MSLLVDIKAAQLKARKDRNAVKATLLMTLITEVTTGIASTLYAEGVKKANQLAAAEKWEPGKLDKAISVLKKDAKAEGWDSETLDGKITKVTELAGAEGWPKGKLEIETDRLATQFNKDWLPSEEQVLDMVGKFVKNARGNLTVHLERGETDKAEVIQHEIEILTDFLPKQLTEGELTEIISNFRAAEPGANVGAIMKHLQTDYKGLYDARAASTLAKG
jgi:uncharacterized protein YqeY